MVRESVVDQWVASAGVDSTSTLFHSYTLHTRSYLIRLRVGELEKLEKCRTASDDMAAVSRI